MPAVAHKVLDKKSLLQAIEEHRQRGLRIVTTNGCFDLLHVGHLRYLQAARQLGDLLVVLVNSDRSVKALKGPSRPITPETERAEMLAGLSCVDYVSLFEESTPAHLLQAIRPHLHVKGGEYNPENLPEAAALEAVGSELAFIPMVGGYSTTHLIQRILESDSQPV